MASGIGIAVILNPASGAGERSDEADRLVTLFAERGVTASVMTLDPGISVRDLVQRAVASGARAVVASGGDGTVSAVAAALVEGDTPLGVIPSGTLNHFAKDLALPLELEEAVDVVVAGRTIAVDVGEVNGRVFVNNSSIGVYPRIVELRDRYRKKGVGKWVAAAWASLAVLRRRPFLGVRIESDEGVILRRTPFVFVGNNEYRMSGLNAGSRESLTGGRLSVYVMKAEGRRRLLRVAWSVLWQGVEEAAELDFMPVVEAEVATRRRHLQVALDGEIVMLQSPLHYRILPGALRVLTPAGG